MNISFVTTVVEIFNLTVMRFIAFLIFAFILTSCKQANQLPMGIWRGTIALQDQSLPFNFEVIKKEGKINVVIHNGAERLVLDEVSVVGDSVSMTLHIFDAEIHAHIGHDQLTGYFIRNYARDYRFPFHAMLGDDFRFQKPGPATTEYSGHYAVKFYDEKDTLSSVGIFEQQDNNITGTFLFTDGDYRYLEGGVVDDQMKLSAFDGNHAYLFTARKSGDTLRGDFYSGKSFHQKWVAIKDENAKLPDAEKLTHLKPGYEKIDFSFPDVDGKMISSTDDLFKNKVVILQISGTWCPNCMDETRFLVPWYEKNKARGVEILGLAYERKDDFKYASERVKKMKEKLNVGYPYVIAGVNDKAKVAMTLPALNEMLAFPTTIFIGKDGKVKHIHTGFSGPGTGVYYEQFIERFDAIVKEMLAN